MAGKAYTRNDSRPGLDKGDSTLVRYNNIASSILNSNVGGADLEDLYVNSAKEGSYLKLKSIVDSCAGGSFPLNVNARDKRTGNTALIWACKRGHSKAVNLLLTHGVDLSLQNYNKQSALEVASPLNKQAIVDCVDHGDASYATRLLHAAWIGNHVIVNDILTSGRPVDINVCNTDGFTPLLLCTRDLYTMEKLGVQLLKNYQPTTIVNDLIQCKADTTACDSEGRTALHYCASSKASNALPLTSLLAKNTPIDIRDRRSLSPLHYACQAGNIAIAKLLIEYGANFNGEGFGGTTPLHIAAFNNFQQLATLLLEYGASLTQADDKGETPPDVARNRKFKAMLKSWRPTQVSRDTPGELMPIKVTNLAGESKAERSWSARQEGATSSLREGSAGKHIHREKTRLLGDMTGTPHRTSTHPSLFLGQLKASLSQPSPSASRERLSSGSVLGSAENSLRPTRLNGTLSADNPLIDSTTKDILELVRRPSSYNIPPASPQPDILTGQKASTVFPFPKLASIRSPGHGRISPYSNLPEISSNSPLTTIPENSDSLPRSVMVDREILRQGSPAEISSNTQAKSSSQGKQASTHLPSSLPTEITQQVAMELSSTKQISAPKKINTPSKRQPRKSKLSTTRQSFTNNDTSSIKAVKSKTPSVSRSNASNSSGTGTSQDKQVRSSAGKITVNNSGKLSDMLGSDVKSRDSETDDAINSSHVYSMEVELNQNSGAGISRELAGRLKVDPLTSATDLASSLSAAKTTAEPAASSSDCNNAAGGRCDDDVNGNHPIRKTSQGKENLKPTKIAQPKFKPTVVSKKPTNISADSKKRQPTALPVTKPAVDKGASKNSPTCGNKSEESPVSKDSVQLGLNQQTVKSLTVPGDESATKKLNSVLNSEARKDFQDDSRSLSTRTKTSKSEPTDTSYTLNPSLQPTPSDVFSHHLSSKHNSSSQQPVGENVTSQRASLYKPLHLLMNAPLASTSSGHRVGEQPATELLSADQDSTPAQGYYSSTSHMNSSEYHGPIIEDIFENFPRPLYEFAAAVAQDSANQKAIQKRKKKKTQPSSKGGDSRASSATTRGSRSSNRTRKGQRNKKSKKQTEKSESEKKEGGENHSIISGVNWHINADPSSDLEIVIENDGLTEEDSDGQEIKDSPHQTKRGLSLHDMSPRQRREELKNMLLLMRNSRHPARVVSSNDGTTTSLLPETMQAIQEFVSAVPNEDELTRLFALDTVHVKDTDMSGEESEESIPDVSEVVMLDDIDDLPAMVISTDPLPAQRASSTSDIEEEIPEELGERCASTAMSDIIDEILSTPVPNKSLRMSMNSPLLDVREREPSSPRLSSTLPAKSPLTGSLLEEIKGQWRQTRQLVDSQDPSEVLSSVLTRKSSGTISLTAATAAVFKAGVASNDEEYLWNEADIVQHYDLDPASTTPVVTRLDTPVVTHELNTDPKSSTHRSDQDGDASHLLTWRKGNVLGKGAYGTVYCGMTSDGHLIAVKQIELNVHDWEKAELEYESIQQEVELLKNLSHDNIVGFLGTSMENHVVSIFMQFIPGGTISSLLTRFGAFEERVFQRFTLQIVDGVRYLHQNDIIHRDIKGANIMLMLNGVIKLIDFGCARRLCFNLSVSQSQIFKSMKGTPYWMAPEVIKETGYGLKSDVWSIGCTVFEMATTSPPWSHMEPIPAMFAIGSNTTPVPELPDHFSDNAKKFVALCLQREEANRSSSSELLQSEFLTSKA